MRLIEKRCSRWLPYEGTEAYRTIKSVAISDMSTLPFQPKRREDSQQMSRSASE